MAHTGRPGDIPSVCIVPAFCQVVRCGASWPILSTCLCLHTSLLVAASFFGVCLRFFSSQMKKRQNVQPPLGTTEWNHSYYTGNTLSALHSLQQLQAGASPRSSVQMSASTRVSHSAAPSSSVSCPQVTLSAANLQVQTGPTRTITSDLLSLRLPRSSPLLHSWSVASLLMLPRRSRYQSPPHLWSRNADFSSHRCLSSLVQGILGSTFYARCSLSHVFPARCFVTS